MDIFPNDRSEKHRMSIHWVYRWLKKIIFGIWKWIQIERHKHRIRNSTIEYLWSNSRCDNLNITDKQPFRIETLFWLNELQHRNFPNLVPFFVVLFIYINHWLIHIDFECSTIPIASLIMLSYLKTSISKSRNKEKQYNKNCILYINKKNSFDQPQFICITIYYYRHYIIGFECNYELAMVNLSALGSRTTYPQ